jgi:hypothetical protein
MRKTETQIRDNFIETMEDSVSAVLGTENRDEKLMAIGAGMMMATKCAEWHLLRDEEQKAWDEQFESLLEVVRDGE